MLLEWKKNGGIEKEYYCYFVNTHCNNTLIKTLI